MAKPRGKRRSSAQTTEAESYSGIRAIPVAYSVLEAVATFGRPSALREIAERAQLTPSRTHRYLAGLVAVSLVKRDDAIGYYDIGEKLVEFGLRAVGRVDPISIGTDMLVRVATDMSIDCHLSVWGSNGPTVIRWQQGSKGYAIKVPEGRNMPLLDTATGRTFLAYMTADETREHVQREIDQWNIHKPDDKMITLADVDAICSEVRRHGIAAAMGTGKSGSFDLTSPGFLRGRDRGHGVAALAVPIFASSGRICMVLTLIGVAGSFDTKYTGETAKKLMKMAQEFSVRLGAPPSIYPTDDVLERSSRDVANTTAP